MPQIFVNLGVQWLLEQMRADLAGKLRVGLFENDYEPTHTGNIGRIVPCTFSGYSGLRLITAFNAVTFDGVRARVTAGLYTWVHDGGPRPGFVFGYYLVNLAGLLVSAERALDGPANLTNLGQVYKVTPTLTLRSEF